eukprot:UN04586
MPGLNDTTSAFSALQKCDESDEDDDFKRAHSSPKQKRSNLYSADEDHMYRKDSVLAKFQEMSAELEKQKSTHIYRRQSFMIKPIVLMISNWNYNKRANAMGWCSLYNNGPEKVA